MGLFDFLGKKKGESSTASGKPKEIARLERLLGNKLSQNYDRVEAIDELSRIASAESARALLKRFDWNLDPSITDQEEKESCVRGVVAAGEDALDAIRDYCKKAESLTWPLRALKSIVPSERLADELLGILDQFDTEYVRNVEPKLQLLKELADHPSEDVRIAIEPFLNDMSEPVRFEAATSVFAMNDPQSLPSLIEQLAAEESLRVKNRIAQGMAEKGWELGSEQRSATAPALPQGFALDGNKVRARG